MCGFIAQTLLLLISTTNAQEHDYFGLKYAEPVIHAEALDPIYGSLFIVVYGDGTVD